MPPAFEVLLLNTAVPQIQAAQAGDTYVVPRDIAFSAVANLANGTYLLPSLAFSSDTDTGIFRQGANQLGFTAGGGTDQMVLTSTGLGIGTSSPSYKLDVNGSIGIKYSNANAVEFHLNNTNPSARAWVLLSTGSSWAGGGQTGYFNIYDNTAGAQRLTIDASGNLGLGVTPSVWDGAFRALQVGVGGSVNGGTSLYEFLELGANYRSATGDKYLSSTTASKYRQHQGIHSWYTAPSGTAGNAISFTQAMTLDASGQLMVGTTSPQWTLANRGVIEINGSSYSLLGFDVNGVAKGYVQHDGTTFKISQFVSGPLVFETGGTEHARITSGGDFQTSSGNSVMVGGTAARATTAGTNRVDIFDGTAPVGTLANGVSFYSASGEANVMDAAGNATLLSPHDAVTNEWIFRSKHTPTGKVLKIDVERLLKFVNDHFGLDAVHEFIED